jgi:hypothetical protein
MPERTELPTTLRPGRRGFLGAATGSIAGIALAGAMGLPRKAEAGTVNDTDIFNFALNLEYLEAEYYQRATTGQGLPMSDTTGTGTYGGVISTPPTPMVTFTDPVIQNYAMEVAQDELNHVLFLRAALGSSAVAEPTINLGTAWNTLAQAAGFAQSFDPYASELNFLLGAFVFEDVGVTAYNGAATLLTVPSDLQYAAGILGTEAYHAGVTRALLAKLNQASPNTGILRTTDQISSLRDALDGPGHDDQGLTYMGSQNLTLVDVNSICFARSTTHVLNIVYGNTTTMPGLFFPSGVNGVIQ